MNNKIISVILILMGFTIFYSCKISGSNDTVNSEPGRKSHNTGKNCMNCHKSGGHGNGWFTVAGTLYKEADGERYPNAQVNLCTAPDSTGQIIKSIRSDAKGNFYTTDCVNFGAGLYVVVTGVNGKKTYMGSAVTSGKCNDCHRIPEGIKAL
jgi:hypothetical protein